MLRLDASKEEIIADFELYVRKHKGLLPVDEPTVWMGREDVIENDREDGDAAEWL